MTEKDKDQLQQAMTAAWELRDDIREVGDAIFTGGLTLERIRNLQAKATRLVVELSALSNNAINAIIKLEDEVGTLNDKLEVMAHEASSLEDEVAALQEQVTELNAKESES